MLDFSKVEKKQTQLKWVGFGVNSNVVVASVGLGQSNSGKERLEVKIKFDGADDSSSTNIYMYLSEKALPFTMQNVLDIHEKVGKVDVLKSQNFTSNAQLAEFLNNTWPNKLFRIKLKGEEYIGQDKEGNPRVKTKIAIPYGDFIESMNEFSDVKSIMMDEETKLTFSKGNTNDYSPVDKSSIPSDTSKTAPVADSLPF